MPPRTLFWLESLPVIILSDPPNPAPSSEVGLPNHNIIPHSHGELKDHTSNHV
ncbi:hypothetical protein LDENG_00032340 [Lucifuga dentata]|nr:hypothetical protein LDENG_00032340 [Lucifuga dentata]